jgi:hypothetical protein
MTLRDVDLDTALAIRAAVRGLPGGCIDAVIVAEIPHMTQAARAARQQHAIHVGARRAWAGRPHGLRWTSAPAVHAIPTIH